MPKLKLFADVAFINPALGHIPLLYPWWGNCDKSQLDRGRFDEWTSVGKDYISLVPIEECDAVLLPSEWRTDYNEAYKLVFKAKEYNKKLLIFFNSDSDEDIAIENAIIFRTSLYKSKCKKNEFAYPAWSLDFSKAYTKGSLIVREKGEIPIVGYAGYIDYRNPYEWFKYMRRTIRCPKNNIIGTYLRGEAVRQVFKNSNIRANFILRDKCLTGAMNINDRKEYVRCIINSDYLLVIRGGGNFSYRLYEVLSCGRIPLFVNTDCVLPFDDIINWKKICLWIEQSQIKHIAAIVSKFHASISSEQFKAMQVEARHIYEQWICPTGFYGNIWRYILDARS